MTKYFSVDISNDIHIIKLHETLEQAKDSCLAGATEAHEFADDMDEYEDYESNDLPYAVYGVVLGRAECKKKNLTEEEKDERCSDFDYILEKPEIVDYPKDDDWIKCSDRLPPVNEDGESCSVLLYGMDILSDFGSHQFIGYLMDGKFYCDDGHSPHQCYYVSHWKALTPPPTE